MPLVGRCLDSLWFDTAKDHVLEGVWAILQDLEQPGRLEPDRAKRPDRHPAEPVSHLVPPPQIVRSQRSGPGRVIVQTDLMLDSVAVEDILCGKCQVSDAQLVP